MNKELIFFKYKKFFKKKIYRNFKRINQNSGSDLKINLDPLLNNLVKSITVIKY